jgi:uncharacterized membrane protein YkoI
MYRKIIAGAILFAVSALGAVGTVFAKPQLYKHNARQTKTEITMAQAQTVALKKVPGTIEESKTEMLKGKEVYRFDILGSKGLKTDVWVSKAGKIIKTEREKKTKSNKSNAKS